jgi:hypothetical protein
MACSATTHPIDVVRQHGYDLAFDEPATDLAAAMHQILWGKWTKDEIGEHQFIGRFFASAARSTGPAPLSAFSWGSG